MGSQPIGIQLRKILWENLAGNSCRKFLRENLVGNSCRKILQEILVGKSCGTGCRGKSQIKKGNDWWKFSIWNRISKLRMAKMLILQFLSHFLLFLGPLQAIKYH